MIDAFVWIFEHGLLLFTVILLLYAVMFGYEYIVKFSKFFESEIIPYFFPRYKQTSIIATAGICTQLRFRAYSCLVLCALNLLLTSLNAVLFEIYHPANLIIGIVCLFTAVANAKILGRYEQYLWDASCNKPKEVFYGKKTHFS